MSQYLIDQIKETPNIQLWTHASVSEVHGDTHLEEISVLCSDTARSSVYPRVPCLYSLAPFRAPIGLATRFTGMTVDLSLPGPTSSRPDRPERMEP